MNTDGGSTVISILKVRRKFARMLVRNEKAWEIRGMNLVKNKGIPVGILECGVNEPCVLGGVVFGYCITVTLDDLLQNKLLHGCDDEEIQQLHAAYGDRMRAWVVTASFELSEPVRFTSPRGCVVWVSIKMRNDRS